MESNICQVSFRFHHFIGNKKPLKTLELGSIIISAVYSKTPPDDSVQNRLEEGKNSKAIASRLLAGFPSW